MENSNKTEEHQNVIACDIGGTKMRAALVTPSGVVEKRVECPTDAGRGFDDATRRLVGLIHDVLSEIPEDSIAGIGISSAGPIEPASGTYDHPPNLPGWHGQSMVPHIRNVTGLPVAVIHDAHAAALGEARFGAARNCDDVVYVTVSTGIGGGMISGGQTINGKNGLAGEVGHMIIDPAGPDCNAGCRGCLEVLASGNGIAAEAGRRLAAGATSSISDLANGDVTSITGKHVYRAAQEGDKVAGEIVDSAIEALATGLANLLATFDPAALVVGGAIVTGDGEISGLSGYWQDLLGRVRDRALLRYRNDVPIVKAVLGDDGGLIGAAVYLKSTINLR